MRSPSVRVLLPVLVVLAGGLAGCTASEDGGSPDPLSAKEALEEARPTLQAWNEDAELLAMTGFEGGEASPAVQRERTEEQQQSFPIHADSLPGDGRAPVWMMVVLAGNETRSLRASSQEVVWMDEGGRQAGPGARPVGNWTVDTTDAIEHAREDAEELDRIVAAQDASVFWTLGGGSQGPRWQLRATSSELGEQTFLSIDAISGEVRNRTEMQTTTRTETFEGTLEQSRANATHTVEVERNGTRLLARLSWNVSDEGDPPRLSASLVRDGEQPEPANRRQAPGSFDARWDALRAGTYEVQVQVDDWGSKQAVDYGLRIQIG